MPQMPSGYKPLDMPEGYQSLEDDKSESSAVVSQPGLLERSWNAANTPLVDIRSGKTKTATDEFAAEHPIIGNPMNFALDTLSSLTNPLSVGLGLTTAGSSVATKAGLSTAAKLLDIPSKIAAGGMIGHGGYELVRPEATLPERAGGLLEGGLGVLGLKGSIKPTEASVARELETPKTKLKLRYDNTLKKLVPIEETPKIDVDVPKLNIEAPAVKLSTPATAAENLIKSLENAKPLVGDQEALRSAEVSQRLAKSMNVTERGLEGFKKEKSLLAGKLPKVAFEPLSLDPADVDHLMTAIRDHPGTYGFDKISGREGLEKLLRGEIPQRSEIKILNGVFGSKFTSAVDNLKPAGGKLQSWYDLPRGLMSVDPPFITSAAFRQGNSLLGTEHWWRGWINAAKSYGSKEASQKIEQKIQELPLFKPTELPDGSIGPSYAERVGLKHGDLNKYSKRDEAIRGELAERIPLYGRHVAGNNRAFTSFMNTVSSGTFTNLIEDAIELNKAGKSGGIFGDLLGGKPTPNPLTDLNFGRQIAEFVNTTTKRGKLGVEFGNHEIEVEKHARLLANAFFSPRTQFSQIRMLNPSTYITASPMVRKEYIKAMARTLGTWFTIGELAKFSSNNISFSHDRNSADFGKIRIGNTRIDLPGGLQQFIVLSNRMLPQKLGGGGITSTNTEPNKTGQFKPFGEGYKPETRFSTAGQFLLNRAHPTAKYGADLLSATEREPFHVGDKTLQLMAPMFADDTLETARENPSLASLIFLLSGAGIGTQSYERGSFGKPVFLPEEYDINIGAK